MTSVPHSGAKSVTPGGSVAGVTPFTPGHLYFDDPTWDQKIALRGRKTVYGQPYVVAHVNRPGSARSDDDKRYARLFCASADLLAAVWALVELFERVDGDEHHKAVIAIGTSAIAKATAGETRNAEPIQSEGAR